MQEVSGKNPAPSSWQEAAVHSFKEALPGSSHDVITSELENLKRELIQIKKFEQYDPITMSSVVEKKKYKLVNTICHSPAFQCIRALPDETIFAGGSDGGIYRFFHNSNGERKWTVTHGHTDSVRCLQLLPDGKVVSGGNDGTVIVWRKSDLEGGEMEILPKLKGSVCGVQARPNGEVILASEGRGIWSLGEKGKWARKLTPVIEEGWITCFQAVANDKIISGIDGKGLGISTRDSTGSWNLKTFELKGADIFCLQATSTQSVITGCSDGKIREWTESANQVWEGKILFSNGFPIHSIQVLPDERIVAGNDVGNIFIIKKGPRGWSLSEFLETPGGRHRINDLHVLPNGQILSANSNGTIRTWDGESVKMRI